MLEKYIFVGKPILHFVYHFYLKRTVFERTKLIYDFFLLFVLIKISKSKVNRGRFEGIFDVLYGKMSMLFLTKRNLFNLYIRKIFKNTKR